MLVLPGLSVLSVPKRDALLKQVQAVCPAIKALDSIWIHLVKSVNDEAEKELSSSSSQFHSILTQLLDYGYDEKLEGTDLAFSNGQNVVYVNPRAGSISPWSSKATDIAHLCRLDNHVERLERGLAFVFHGQTLTQADLDKFSHLLHDRMTQQVSLAPPRSEVLFAHHEARPLRPVAIKASQREAAIQKLSAANTELGLALAQDEINYLVDAYVTTEAPIDHDPTDAELFMFAQVNSEHCRHKIFNASWTIDGESKDLSLFQMIRNTEKLNPTGTISAYSDNAAVLEGHSASRFQVYREGREKAPKKDLHQLYGSQKEDMPILVKVETHNHPTAVSPYPGAATGSGGEIRDEGAVGRGSKPKAGLSGFTVSNLLIPGFEQPWETDFGRPAHIASALDIMIEGPLGASAFNNEFGRPALAGYFRTYSESIPLSSDGSKREIRGYHKPIMIAGGYGNVRPQFSLKTKISPGAEIVVLGGPGLLIGLGGGAASSQVSGASSAELDFASVQRDNAEMERRCQQVIDACVSLDERNPIQSIHDVGAGGLSNALPELVHDSDLGAKFEIRDVLVADSSMSPMEIWCNESQERYVLAVSPSLSSTFKEIAERERCPYSVVGVATEEEELIVTDRLFGKDVINLKMSTLFGKPPKMSRKDTTRNVAHIPFDTTLSSLSSPSSSAFAAAVDRVLHLPSVASKSFLITIGDRSITGLVAREQMVGPYQVPVADVAVTLSSYGFGNQNKAGEAMAMGERTPLALLSPGASARMAIAESLLNLSATLVGEEGLAKTKLSANWMCAASKEGEGAGLYEAVQAVGMELCPALGVGIPVGKDSMSMSMKWTTPEGEKRDVSSPLSLIVTAFAPVEDVAQTWTPQPRRIEEKTVLVFFDLAKGKTRVGGSALTQVFKELGDEAPDVEDPAALRKFLAALQSVRTSHPDLILAYHDRSDGGLFTTLVEMAFAGRVGLDIELKNGDDPIPFLFNEELGAVVQVRESQLDALRSVFGAALPDEAIRVIGHIREGDEQVMVRRGQEQVFSSTRAELQKAWAETSYKMQSLRDDPSSADSEYSLISSSSSDDPALFYDLSFTPKQSRDLFRRPKVAVLREQGVNGQVEMAYAFTAAGFDAVDVHMSDILSSRVTLKDFKGLVACGGFSYGDVLGAGKGWANSILLNPIARKEFEEFFARENTFTLGVCNGCQFLSYLRDILPEGSGAKDWPYFKPNQSGRFEGRTVMVEVGNSESTKASPFFREMVGSKLPIAVAHGEGRASFTTTEQQDSLVSGGGVGLRYLGGTQVYPLNPNGSVAGIAGVQTRDGRVLALMPHPERNVDLRTCSWYPDEMLKDSEKHGWNAHDIGGPWFRMFQSARSWCGQ